MRLGKFRDNGGNVNNDMFTLSLSDDFVKDIENTEFENEDINDLRIITKSGKRNGYKKVTIPIVNKIYTCLEEYILKYELMGASYYKDCVNTNTGYFVYNYSWVETYERVEETTESVWYIIGRDKLYFDKQEMKRMLANYNLIEDN